MRSGSLNLSIADGDRIIVPPIGPTAAVTGEVTRPGIYELAKGTPISGQDILAFAGGTLRPNGNRFVKLSIDASGKDITTETSSISQVSIRPGDILMALRQEDVRVGYVRLDGHVRALASGL